MQEAAQAIAHFVAGVDEAVYAGSDLLHSGVERKFEIIGEALNQLSQSHPALATRVPQCAQVIAFRNQLIHGYALIDHATVWGVITNDLPVLHAALAELLRELPPP